MATIHRETRGGTWYISYRQDGRQYHRSLGTQNERAAREMNREIELIVSDNGHAQLVVADKPSAECKNPTIEEFWNAFSTWASTNRSANTLSEYRNWFHQFAEHSKIERLEDATVGNVEAFKTHLLCNGKRKPSGVGLEKISINDGLKTLKSIWNHGKKLSLYTGGNPFTDVEVFKLPQREDRGFLAGDEVDALLDASEQYASVKYVRLAEARNVRIAIALMALAGLRKGEACFAVWSWVRLSEKILAVTNHDEFTTKSGRNRVIPIHERLSEILSEYKEDEGYLLKSTRPNERAYRYRADFRKSFDRVCELAGVKATPHDLRHSFASRHAIRGRLLHVIAGWLGHSTTWVTERYAHYQREYDEDVNDI